MIIWINRPLANDHPDGPTSCKWSSGWTGLLQVIIPIDRLLQMIIQRVWPLANDHMEDTATCKWSLGRSTLLQMIIWKDRPFANDHREDPPSWNWSSRGSGPPLSDMLFWLDRDSFFFLFEINPEFWPQNWLFWDFFFVTTFFIGFFVDSF